MIRRNTIPWTLICAMCSMIGVSATTQETMAQDQEFMRRIPEVVQPEPYQPTRTKTGGTRVLYPVDPQSLRQALSKPLSEACGRLEFNLARHGRYFVIVPQPDKEPLRFGYAQGDGLNLLDPTGLRGADLVYLFYRDETSQCKVYAYPKAF